MELSNNPARMWSSCLGSTILGAKEEPGTFQTTCAQTKMASSPGSGGCADQDSVHPTFTILCSDRVLVEMGFVPLLPGVGAWTRSTSGWILLYAGFISIHSLFEPSLSFLRYLTFYF